MRRRFFPAHLFGINRLRAMPQQVMFIENHIDRRFLWRSLMHLATPRLNNFRPRRLSTGEVIGVISRLRSKSPIGYQSVSDTWSLANPVRKVAFKLLQFILTTKTV